MFGKDPAQVQTNSTYDPASMAPDPLAVNSGLTNLMAQPAAPAPDPTAAVAAPVGPPAMPDPITSAAMSLAPSDPTTAPVAAPAPAAGIPGDLLSIKQEALQHLSPLVNHLEQSPEEKFRTTMMMIQASDDQTLVKDAYEAAKQITDDKARAQALLDVVNEINYFTQHQNS